MDDTIRISTPLTEEIARSLRSGQQISITGKIYTARDMAHKRMCEAIEKGQSLPFDLEDAVIYFVGPSPAGRGRIIGAAGPTTSSRMDPFSPVLMRRGLRGMIGKGYRNESVRKALAEYGAVHFSAVGGAGALLSKHIVSAKVIAYEDLATEAVRELEVVDFPVFLAYDTHGGTIYKQ